MNPRKSDEEDTQCGGDVHQLVWLDKGERITLVVCAEATRWYKQWGMHFMDVEADLSITPFKTDKSWLEDKLDANGDSSSKIDYNEEESDFAKDHINLMKFLPSNKKADDWLSNFCKAFNLDLYYNDDTERYHLDVKRKQNRLSSSIIDLDNRANVTVSRTNQSLGIPKEYKIGFTVSPDEEGYNASDKFKNEDISEKDLNKIPAEERYNTGGGTFKTGSIETNTIEQSSNFSYCWYKDIKFGEKTHKMPIISDKEVWKEGTRDYEKMMEKDYINKPQRFWYKDGILSLSGLGGDSENKIKTATVTNELKDRMVLDYEDKPNSIMNNYFAIYTNADNSFTTVESYLTPDEYAALDYSYIKLNGDIYYLAEVDGFDPMGRKTCKLKLIRKLL